MATIQTGSIVSDIRGSVGTETYSRNRSGLYVKARANPAQPASVHRDAAQAAFTTLTQAWSGTLTEAQRFTWRQYAKVWKAPNRLGQRAALSPICHFVRSNFYGLLTLASIQFLDAPPAGPAHLPSFTFTAAAALDGITVALPPGTYDPLPGQLDLYLSVGRQVNAGRLYYSTPWRFQSRNHWNGAAWTTDPWNLTSPWNLDAGKKLFCRLTAVLADGETSGNYQCSALIT